MAFDDDERRPAADLGRTARWVLAAMLIVGLVALGIDNRRDVRIGWVFGDGDAPIWLVVLVAAVAGAIVGWLFSHRPRQYR